MRLKRPDEQAPFVDVAYSNALSVTLQIVVGELARCWGMASHELAGWGISR